jgi:hypothetical protein
MSTSTCKTGKTHIQSKAVLFSFGSDYKETANILLTVNKLQENEERNADGP